MTEPVVELLAAALPKAMRMLRASKGGLYEHKDGTWHVAPDYEWAAEVASENRQSGYMKDGYACGDRGCTDAD